MCCSIHSTYYSYYTFTNYDNIILTLVQQIEGTIVAPDDPDTWDPKNSRTWLDFYKLKGVLFQGHGVIDGSGSKWWASSCKKNKTNVIFFFLKLLVSILIQALQNFRK